MDYLIRNYKVDDEAAVLAAFDSNVPKYFDLEERKEFVKFLRALKEEVYEVLEQNGKLIAAGGFCTQEPGEARIVWFMVESDHHQDGWGSILLEGHLKQIEANPEYKKISLMTSQYTDGFYEKLGFYSTKFKEDYWSKGMHLVMMEKELKAE